MFAFIIDKNGIVQYVEVPDGAIGMPNFNALKRAPQLLN
jgi:alkyl hydroperoxide reductase subunit AhpC